MTDIEVTNPATGDRIGTVRESTAGDVDEAVGRAETAFLPWSGLEPRARGKILFRAAGQIRAEQDDLAMLLTTEQGKPLHEARNEIQGVANVFEYYTSISGTIRGSAQALGKYGTGIVRKDPLGVCAAIIPWNMPALILTWKTGPALVAGNSVLIKPSAETPLTSMRLAAILHQAGVPEDALQIVTGRGSTTGAALVRHPGIKKISFTGSAETGREVAAASAAGTSLKRLTLELGGSDAMIVCADADPKAAALGAAAGRFYNCGQTCTAVKRLFVAEELQETFMHHLIAAVSKMVIGDGRTAGIMMGPLNNTAGRNSVMRAVGEALDREDATLVSGGTIPKGEAFQNGHFFEPTILSDLPADSVLLTEEIFGPVLPVVAVASFDEAIEAANATGYGLGASVWTHDMRRVSQAAEQIESGMLWVNQHLSVPPDVPFGGEKRSGLGRENGPGALDNYLREKTILIKP